MVTIKYNEEVRNAIMSGVDQLADAVKVTLGPKGGNVIIDKLEGNSVVTKDGVTVAKAIDLEDPLENIGANLIKQVASNANDNAGDGTTTATVLTQAILKEGLKLVAAGYNPLDLKNGIDKAVKEVVAYLNSIAVPVDYDSAMIKQIASISANNDEAIGELVADVFGKVGKEGAVSVESSKNMTTTVEVVDGLQFDRGMLSPYFSTDPNKLSVTFEDPYILLCSGKMSTVESVMTTLEPVVQSGRPLVIIAKDIDGQALATLVMNRLRGSVQVCAVKAPGFGEWQKALLEDIAVITGGEVVSNGEEATGIHLGEAQSITVTQMNTVIVGGKGKKEDIVERVTFIEAEKTRKAKSLTEFEIKKYQERISKLSGGVGVIYVGATTETEMKELKDRYEDAKCAVIAAIAEGIVPGGGTALLMSVDTLTGSSNDDIQRGISIVKKAIESPIRTICENANVSADVVIDKVLKLNENTDNKVDIIGYDAKRDEYSNMISFGIIDPKKVTRVALENAASIAGTVLTTKCALIQK